MKCNSHTERRVLFTADAKLTIFRRICTTMAAAPATDQTADDGQVTLSGYAIVWNVLSDDRGGFKVKLLPGSAKFADTVHALFHHDYRAILGTTANGSLRISSDEIGVKVEIDLPATQCANDVAELVEAKYVKGMSFSMLWDGIEYDVKDADTDQEVMEVKSFLCDEVTVTAIPAFTETSIGSKTEGNGAASAEVPSEMASVRSEQTIRLDQLRLANMKI